MSIFSLIIGRFVKNLCSNVNRETSEAVNTAAQWNEQLQLHSEENVNST